MNCIVCDQNHSTEIYRQLRQCQNCGFVWANPQLYDVGLYGDDYFFGEEYASYLKEEPALKKNFQRNLKILTQYVPSGRLLDIGCAYGFFLEEARSHYETEGIDVNARACQHAKDKLGLNVRCGDFLEEGFPKNHYDVIVMWATLEHVPNPHLYIKKIGSLLKPGGIFACSTPDIGSVMARVRKERWRQIHPPSHLSYFSRGTLTKLLSVNGLSPIHLARLGEYRTMDMILYGILVIRKRLSKMYSFLKRIGFNRGMFYLNLYDTLYLVASKRGEKVTP